MCSNCYIISDFHCTRPSVFDSIHGMENQRNASTAIVVTRNRRKKLLTCVQALKRQSSPCDVLVIDNDSTDGTREAVTAVLVATDTYLNTGANLGGAGGFARGIKEAVERGYEFIWIMDDDVVPASDALEKLLKADAALGNGYGWLSSRCVMPDGSLCPMNLQRKTPFEKMPVAELAADVIPVRAQMASFVSLFFRTGTVRRFGLPLAEFFIWSDDLEWTRRVSREVPCYAVPASTVTHDIAGSAASNVAVDTAERIPRYFYAFRNEFLVYRREGLRGLAYYFAKVALKFIRIVFRARGHRWLRLKTLVSGVCSGLVFRPQT